MTREQLAVRIGVSSSTLAWAERAGLMTERTAERIADALGVRLEELQA